jgi:hypothetical protein
VLGNLLKWVLHVAGTDDFDGTKKGLVRNIPLLLIDDEADNGATVNTKDQARGSGGRISDCDQRENPLAPRFIREVGVRRGIRPRRLQTSSSIQKREFEARRDLFPRSFIINAKPPSNYVGPARVFGLNGDPDSGIPASNGLPIVREI